MCRIGAWGLRVWRDKFFQEAVGQLDLFPKASRLLVLRIHLLALRIHLRLKFFETCQLNAETFPELVELIFDDRENVSPRHRRSWGPNRTLRTGLACLSCFTYPSLRAASRHRGGLLPRSSHVKC